MAIHSIKIGGNTFEIANLPYIWNITEDKFKFDLSTDYSEVVNAVNNNRLVILKLALNNGHTAMVPLGFKAESTYYKFSGIYSVNNPITIAGTLLKNGSKWCIFSADINNDISNFATRSEVNEAICKDVTNGVMTKPTLQGDYFYPTAYNSVQIYNISASCSLDNGQTELTDSNLSSFKYKIYTTHLIIKNTASSDITITIPNSTKFINLSEDSITIPVGDYAEINIILNIENGVSTYYIRSI